MFYIIVNNQWVVSDDYEWVEISGASQVISTTIEGWMTDKGDGTYTYSITIVNTGVITIQVLFYDQGILGIYYPNTLWSTPSTYNEATSILNNDWGTGDV